MYIKQKSKEEYWQQFSSYQSFSTVEEMNEQIKRFVSTYDLTPSMKAVLNTIKLHAKRYFVGVCWMYREQIARKAKVSLSSVKRAIKALQEAGILTVHEQIHTKRGGQTHNVYVINPIFETPEEPANEPPSEDSLDRSETVGARVSDDKSQSGEQIDTVRCDILKNVPKEFVDLMKPFYANNPDLILARWKTVCVAVKKNCGKFAYTSWDTISQAWKDTVKKLKRGRIRTATDDGIGGYFYGTLCDYLMDDYWRNASGTHI